MTDENKSGRAEKLSYPSGFHLEADRSRQGLTITLSGIVGINDFSNDYIHLKGHGGRIEVLGKNLFISVYENGSVEIVGTVGEIIFKYGKN